MSEIPAEAYTAAMRACYDAITDIDMDYTAHKPVQGLAAPKVLAYCVLEAVAPLIRQATADEIAKRLEGSNFHSAAEIARRVGDNTNQRKEAR